MVTGASGQVGQSVLKNVEEEKGKELGFAMIQLQFKVENSVKELGLNQSLVMKTHVQVCRNQN